MRERPILFNGAMVRAILDGRKTQTRRAVKGIALDWLGKAQFTPEYVASPGNDLCPFGQPGDRLWVRETTVNVEKHGYLGPVYLESEAGYATLQGGLAPAPDDMTEVEPHEITLRPSIHMPRSMCRLVLEITAVRVERLQAGEGDTDIESRYLAESINRIHHGDGAYYYNAFRDEPHPKNWNHPDDAFRELWSSTGGDWNCDPWVWVIDFERVEVQS